LFSQTVYKTESVWYTKKTFWCEFFLIKFGEERKYFLQQKKHFGAKRDFLVGEKMGVLCLSVDMVFTAVVLYCCQK
jgi:hypothetical protein